MNRYLYILIMWLCSLSVFAQTAGYNPSNPPLPNLPDTPEVVTKYVLSVNTSPLGCGNVSSGGQYLEQQQVSLRAYDNGNFYFKYWVDDEGNVLTTSKNFTYTMPGRDVTVTAVYRYTPANPGLPDFPEEEENIPTYTLALDSKPAGAGSFNMNTTSQFRENETPHVYAYDHDYLYFQYWENEAGERISTARGFYYTMPAADSKLYAVYKYNPGNPANPGRNSYDAWTGEVIIDDFTPGSIWDAINEVTKGNNTNITKIIVAGRMNSGDFTIANSFSTCTIVDFSRTTGVTSIPYYCYESNSYLNRIYLPASISRIESYAFRNASALTEMTIHAAVPPTLESYVFDGVTPGLVVHVPLSSIQLYETADVWKDYVANGTIVIMPITSEVASLEVNLPEECVDGRYKNMPLELLNVKSGQRFKYVVTDRLNYVYNNLIQGTRYVATLKNLSGTILAQTDTVDIDEENMSISFTLDKMKQLRTVKATVLTPGGTDVTANCNVTWTAANGTFLQQGGEVAGQVSETKMKCSVALSQALAMEYGLLADSLYEVIEDDNNVVFTLQPLPTMTVSGRIYDVTTELPIPTGTVTISQTLNGRYNKSIVVNTDNKGRFSATIFAAPTSLTYAANDYISKTAELSDNDLALEDVQLSSMGLKPITGATITTNFTYSPAVAATVTPEVQQGYAGYANVAYDIYNVTKDKAVSQFNVQYPKIVLLEEVDENDSLRIIASSKNGAFVDITTGGRIDATNRMTVNVPVVQLGGIQATFNTTENSKVLGILYDANGNFVSKYTYSSANLTISNLADGRYTLVAMGQSDFFGSVFNLATFDQAGLQNAVDYVATNVVVKSGIYSPVKNVVIPFFDESKFYYTGENTSFSVNKTSIVAGNYLTMTANVDFKPVYASNVSDVKLSVELPEGTTLVDNSVMVGSSVAFYEVDGRTVTIPLANNETSNRVRFCVIPTVSGSFAPSASVEFNLADRAMVQPLGSVSYNVKSLAINVPEQIASQELVITGVATGGSDVTVYADGEVLGTTKSLANGYWTLEAQLPQPFNLQEFSIYAKVVTKQGLELQTSTQKCVYNKDYVIAKTVDMSFYNGWLHKNINVTFDLEHARVSESSYMFYTGTDITFTANLSDNSTEKVNGVTINVYTDKQQWFKLKATYNSRLDRWVAVHRFESNNLPVGVTVDIDAFTPACIDANIVAGSLLNLQDFLNEIKADDDEVKAMLGDLTDIFGEEDCDYDALIAKLQEINDALGIDSDFEPIEDLTEEDVAATMAEIDALLADGMVPSFDALLGLNTADLSSLKEYLHGIEVNNCDGLTDALLMEQNYERIMKSDSTYLYILATADKYEMVDLSLNVRISFTPESEMFARLSKAGGDGIEKLEYYCEEINKYLNDFMTVIQGISDAIDQVEKKCTAANVKLTNLIKTLNRQLSTMASKHAPWYERAAVKAKITAAYLAKSTNNLIIKKIAKNFKELRIGSGASKAFGVFGFIFTLKDAVSDLGKLIALHKKITPCPNDEANASGVRARIIGTGVGAGVYYVAQLISCGCAVAGVETGIIGAIPTGGVSLGAAAVSVGVIVANCAATIAYGRVFENSMKELTAQAAALKCYGCNCENGQPCTCPKDKCLCPKCQDDDDDPEPYPICNPIHDPSGYVYEGVSSNRLQGVTATAYYKEVVEDMYGDLHENIVLWDAEEYAQQNPLFTDENGMYQWDVPQGLWQVKFEKEGYVTTQSEWLPVPPPQMDVNVGMVQNAQPEIVKAKAYEDGVEIEFSKYMDEETLTTDNIYVKTVKDEVEEFITDATIEFLNEESVVEGSDLKYASKVKLLTDKLGYYDEAYIIVSTAVNSYAGIPMANVFQQELDVETKVREIKVEESYNVAYLQSSEITIAAVPADAAAGKTVLVSSASESIATTSVAEVTLDADGQATFSVTGELLGSTALNFEISDADLKKSAMVNVVDPKRLELVKDPVASRLSGTSVFRGQTVTLSCESEGAVVYYTTDGSCPCEEGTRQVYDRPIVINGAMTLKIQAVGTNGDESEVKTYEYAIRQSDVKLNLVEGWNWNSHDLSEPLDINELTDIASCVLTQTDEVINDPVCGFVGTLTTIDGSETMKIKTDAQAFKSFVGEQYNPTKNSIHLVKGWNWLGYPLSQTMTLNDAFSYLDVEEGDVVSSLEQGFATYTDGAWVGDLETLVAGNGYLFKSQSDKEFVYNLVPTVANAKALYGHRLALTEAPWTVNKHQYPNLMPVIAQVCYSDDVAVDSAYYVAAFVGDECRGVAKYEDESLFLSVYGNALAAVTFKAVNVQTGAMHDFVESLSFDADMKGSVREPFKLHLNMESTDIRTVVAPSAVNGIYTINGVKVDKVVRPGFYIVKGIDADGKTLMMKQYIK